MMFAVACSSSPGEYGCEHTSAGRRDTLGGPRCVTASSKSANVTESSAVPMCVTCRPGQTSWIITLVAPRSAEVGCGPVVGCTVSSVAERTVVQAVGPGVSSRPRRLSAFWKREPAICWNEAGVQPSRRQPARLPAVVPCCVPAAATTSETFLRRLGQ
jgi:hypothetical protein